MKYLIVNGDDFGASRGINRAIVELHELGVLTSTSLMIATAAADDALELARAAPGLSVGLHVELTREDGAEIVDFSDPVACSAAIQGQIDEFLERFGRLPTHLDAHQNVHRDKRLVALFAATAARYALPLREHSPVRYFSAFYGQWEGEMHPEHISVESLIRMLDCELRDGITELSCHPGYPGSDFSTPYDSEREIEVRTLSDPRFRAYLEDRQIRLVNFTQASELLNLASIS